MFIEFYSSLGFIDFNLWGNTTLQNWAYLPFLILDHCLFHYLLARARCIIIYACGTSMYQATRSVIFCFDYRLLLLKISAKTQSEQEWDFSLVFFGNICRLLVDLPKSEKLWLINHWIGYHSTKLSVVKMCNSDVILYIRVEKKVLYLSTLI